MRNFIVRIINFFLRNIFKNESADKPDSGFLVRTEGKVGYYKTPIGNYHLPMDNESDAVINVMKAGEFFEYYIVETANEFIKENTVVLDIGAHFGQMSIEFSKRVGANGKVYSFEADPFIYQLLEKNIISNNAANVQPIFGAVFDSVGKELFYPEQDFKRFGSYGSYGIDIKATSGRKIPSLTIDSLNIQEPISFMKVDIQGSDLFAMKGAVNTISRNRMPIIFEFEQQFQVEFNTTFNDYVDFVRSIDYKFLRTVSNINFLIVPREFNH